MSIDWPSAIAAAREQGRQAGLTVLLAGGGDGLAGHSASYASLLSWHGPTGSPSGTDACRLCGVDWPCPPVALAAEFDPAVGVVVDAHDRAGG